MKKTLATIGLCRRAGKLLYGFCAVTEEVGKAGSAVSGVILADDLSEKTAKEARFVCGKHGVPVCTPGVTMAELKQIVGKQTGILAVLDEGLFCSINSSEKLGDIE